MFLNYLMVAVFIKMKNEKKRKKGNVSFADKSTKPIIKRMEFFVEFETFLPPGSAVIFSFKS